MAFLQILPRNDKDIGVRAEGAEDQPFIVTISVVPGGRMISLRRISMRKGLPGSKSKSDLFRRRVISRPSGQSRTTVRHLAISFLSFAVDGSSTSLPDSRRFPLCRW